MILKNADSRERDIEELERLIKIAPADRKSKGPTGSDQVNHIKYHV